MADAARDPGSRDKRARGRIQKGAHQLTELEMVPVRMGLLKVAFLKKA